ncbi:yojK [Symbiodinium sp. KB8]|nr:yojK [Symbiodinium sp. KB8]
MRVLCDASVQKYRINEQAIVVSRIAWAQRDILPDRLSRFPGQRMASLWSDSEDEQRGTTSSTPRPPAGPPPPQGMLSVQITTAVGDTIQRFWHFQGPMLTGLRGRLTQCHGITIEVRPMAQHELEMRDTLYFGDEADATAPETEPPSPREMETEAILPGRVSPDMAEIVEDDADGGVETTGEGDRAGSDLEGTGRANVDAKAKPKPKISQTRVIQNLNHRYIPMQGRVARGELSTEVLDIICVQETRWHYDANWVGPDYHFFHSAGLAKEEVNGGGITTLPGPGSMEKIVQTGGLTGAEFCKLLSENSPQLEAIEALKKDLELPDLTLNTSLPLHGDHYSDLNLVTTTEELADEWADDAATYAAQGKAFAFVGPLIDVAGAKRCAGFLKEVEELLPKRSSEESLKLHGRSSAVDEEFPMDVVESAVAAGRSIVLVSMGTVITGDSSNHGWEATDGSSMTGRQLCQAVFKAVFAELGDPAEGGGNLLVVAVGPQADALEGVEVPANALCRNTLPQVDILRLKPRVFVTHGGQNSFMESMFAGTPLVVCPGFADQPANGAKAQAMKVGLCVDRPVSEEAAARYEGDVRDALRQVSEVPAFKHSADRVAQGLREAGGVDRAIQLLIEGRA